MKHHSLDSKSKIINVLLILGIIFVSLNLRPTITSVGPLISAIRSDMNMSNSLSGLITTLPLLVFAILSPLAPRIGKRWGYERTILIGLIVLAVGISIRSVTLTTAFFAGTFLIGLGISVCNVLLPGIIKNKFPTKIGLMTSLYSTTMGISATIAAGVSVPLAQGLNFGWQNALLFWGILAAVAILIWLPQLRFSVRITNVSETKLNENSVWQCPLAWQVTFYFGFQSLLFYCMVAWLPDILHSHGMSVSLAGWMLSLMLLTGVPATFVAPILANRFSDQRGIALTISMIFFVGISGLWFGGHIIFILSTVLLGIAQGSAISFALTLFGLRARDAQQTASLSGMAQSIGYLVAATGPILLGLVFDQTQSWTVPIILMLTASILMGIMGLGAGRNQYLHEKKGVEKPNSMVTF